MRPARATSPTPPSSSPTTPTPRPAPGLYGEDVDPLPKRVAVEVELTRKGAARLREAWTRPRHGRWHRTVYYAPPEVAGYLAGQLQRIRPRHPIQVHPLPEVPGHDLPALTLEVPREPSHRSHEPGRGWQATPGQPIPRAARQPAANGLLLVMLLLVWFSPLSIVAWLLGQAVILLQRRWHWWRFALASLACDRRRAGRGRPRGGPAPAHLRAPALLAVRRPPLRLRPPRHPRSPSASSSGTCSPPRCGWPSRSGCWPPRCRCGMPSGPPAGPSGAPSSAAASASTSAPATAGPPGWSPGPATTSSPRPRSGSPWTATSPAGARAAMWSRRRSCGARPWPWSAPPAPARPSPCCASPTWPGCWAARSASPTARAPTPPWSRP